MAGCAEQYVLGLEVAVATAGGVQVLKREQDLYRVEARVRLRQHAAWLLAQVPVQLAAWAILRKEVQLVRRLERAEEADDERVARRQYLLGACEHRSAQLRDTSRSGTVAAVFHQHTFCLI